MKRIWQRFKTGIIILAAIMILATIFVHTYGESFYVCGYCGSTQDRYHISIIPLPVWKSTRTGALNKYIQQNVDSHHKHIWLLCSSYSHAFRHDMYGDGSGARFSPAGLGEAAIPILKSFPNQRSRKAFWDKLYTLTLVREGHKKHLSKKAIIDLFSRVDKMAALRKAYYKKNSRTDWQQLIQKLDLAP